MDLKGVIEVRNLRKAGKELSAGDEKKNLHFLLSESGQLGAISEHNLSAGSKTTYRHEASSEPDYYLVFKKYDLPMWLTMTCNFSLGEKDLLMFNSPIRNFIWRFVDYFAGNIASTFTRIALPLCNSKILSGYYNDVGSNENHSNLIRGLDSIDYRSVRIELVLLHRVRSFFYSIYKFLVYLLLGPFFALIRLIMPKKFSLRWLIEIFVENPEDREDRMRELRALQPIRSPLPRADLFNLVKENDIVEGLSYQEFAELAAVEEDIRLSVIADDTIEGQFAGVYTEYRQGVLAEEEPIASLFNRDEYYGFEYQGFPWLLHGQRLFYLDAIFIPLCTSIIVLLFIAFYFYNGSTLTGEWDTSSPEVDIFAKFVRKTSKVKFYGHQLVPTSMESFFVSNFKCRIGPNVYEMLQDGNFTGNGALSYSDDEYLLGPMERI